LRQAGFALGATRWQVIREHIFPIALPGILTGTILALSRAIGETAPLIVIGAVSYIAFLPELSPKGLQSSFTALPIQIFDWVSRPQTQFHTNAAAGIIILMVVLLIMNASAIYLRNKFQRNRP
jgi:phosphate transport system permease protein